MTPPGFRLGQLDRHALDDRLLAGINRVNNLLRKEVWPEEGPRGVDETRESIASIPDFVQLHWWAAFERSLLVAHGHVSIFDVASNQHLAEVRIAVDPAYRRRGLAKALLYRLVDFARRNGRRLLLGYTDSLVTGAEAFALRIGAEAAQRSRISRLNLAEIDLELMQAWVERGAAKATDFEVEFLLGPYPKEAYRDIVAVKNVMNTAPRDDLDIEDWLMTEAELEQLESSLQQRAVKRWTMLARRRSDGTIAGFTEVFFDTRHPARIDQGDTAVHPDFRGRGLGRWLKGAMAAKILSELPEARVVYTGNANSNAAMLRINEEMGYRPYQELISWQVGVSTVERYLERAASP